MQDNEIPQFKSTYRDSFHSPQYTKKNNQKSHAKVSKEKRIKCTKTTQVLDLMGPDKLLLNSSGAFFAPHTHMHKHHK